MSNIINIINAGGTSATPLILDLFPDTEYFYSLNRGGANTTDVVEGQKSGAVTENFTPEELEDGTFATFANGGEVRARTLYNQGTVNRPIEQTTFTDMPNLGNPSLYTFNDRLFVSAQERNCFMESALATSILDKDSTVYITFRSQSAQNIGGVFESRQSSAQNRVVVYSDTRTSLFRYVNYAPSSTSNFINFSAQQSVDTVRIYALRRTGNLVEAFDCNGFVGSVTSSDSFSVQTLLVLFRQTQGNLYFRGCFAELMIREKSDSNTDLNAIIQNRKNYYSII